MSTNPPPDDEKEVQAIVNELTQDIARANSQEQKTKSAIRKYFLIFSVTSLLLLFGSLFFLNYQVHEVKEELKTKQETIDNLEQTISSLMFSEQLKEEEFLRKKLGIEDYSSLIDDATKELVEDNLNYIQKMSDGHKGENVSRGNTKFKEIALTFDLASGEELGRLYSYLEKYPIKVTVFVSNERASDTSGSFFVASNLRNLKKMSELNNRVEFGNHTWSHFNFVRSIQETSLQKRRVFEYISNNPLTLEVIAEDMKKVEDRMVALTGQAPQKFYRLPYGAVNRLILDAMASLGYTQHIMWSANTRGSLDIPDYIQKQYIVRHNPETGKKQLIANPFYKTSTQVLDFLNAWESADTHGMNGAIILMHLGSPRKFDKLFPILETYIPRMIKKGYKFVTVSEVLNSVQD